jgi:hypothetical protein
VRIEGADRAGLERLLRYCARPPFALERLEQVGHDQLVYRLPKPQPDGRTELRLSPLELIEREVARARGPPLWDPAPEPLTNWDEAPAPVPSVSSSISA